MAFSWNLPKQLLLIWRCYDVFYVCLLRCIKLYSLEVALCKISGLKHKKILKLLIHEPLTIFLNHPVLRIKMNMSISFIIVYSLIWFFSNYGYIFHIHFKTFRLSVFYIYGHVFPEKCKMIMVWRKVDEIKSAFYSFSEK